MPFVLPFEDESATLPEYTGGKGASLARLTRLGFHVPSGMIVSAQAYRDFIQPVLDQIESMMPSPDAAPDVSATACAAIRKVVSTRDLPPGVEREVRAWLDAQPESAYAVRSSSTFEDLAGAAFAGQHDTHLNVRGAAAILARIRDCFVSLWGDRAVAYRSRKGYDSLQAAMAVVVQRMIPCEAAGVGFSVNPVSGDMGEMVVDANFGLGESVVGGEAAVDHWEVSKADGRVRRAVIAEKSVRVVPVPGGTAEEHIGGPGAAEPSLRPEALSQVVALLREVEEACQFPQDIEWGFAGGRLWLLQARPITTIPPRWTRDESAERFPNAITPLTWDFVNEGFHRSLDVSFRMLGFPACRSPWFALHEHYVYGNQNIVELYLRRPVYSPSSLEDVRKALPSLRERFGWVRDLPQTWARDLDHYLLQLGALAAEPLAGAGGKDLWGLVLRIQHLAVAYFEPNIAISITQAMLHRLLDRLVRLVAGAEGQALLDGLMGLSDTKTAIINRELFEIAFAVRGLPDLKTALLQGDSRDLLARGLFSAHPALQERFARFLRDHGHREIEFDMYHAPWGEAPWVVLDHVRQILQGPMDAHPAELERTRRIRAHQAEAELMRRTPEDLRFFLHEIIRLTRAYTALDDLEHYQTMRLTPVYRRALRAFGGRIAAAAGFEDPMDVYFARREQIEQALTVDRPESWTALGRQIREQKQAWLEARGRAPLWDLGKPEQTAPAGLDEWTGLAGSAGIAEGEVRIVRDAEDFAAFPKGAVLVARTTNPSWTPLFYCAAAVVTESGGPLSHGAVTAREMGIPAVMSVRGILGMLRNGQRVRVDGSGGKVKLIG